MSESGIYLILLYALLEYIEFSLQKGESLKEILLHNLEQFRKNITIYMLSHSSFFMILVLIFVFNISNIYIYLALIMKGADLGFKFYLIGRLEKEGDSAISLFFGGIDIPLGKGLKIINSFIYITLVGLSLVA